MNKGIDGLMKVCKEILAEEDESKYPLARIIMQGAIDSKGEERERLMNTNFDIDKIKYTINALKEIVEG